MARTRTLANLRTDVRQRADMENSTFVSDNELTEYINQSIAELYDLLVNVYGDDYYATSANVSVSSTTGVGSLPADFYKLIQAEYVTGGNNYPLRRLGFPELRANQVSEGWSSYVLPGYTIVGSSLYTAPIPSTSSNVLVWYIPAPTRLSADGDTFDGISGWEEYVVVDVAAKCLEKEETNADHMIQRKLKLEQRIIQSAPTRDKNEPWTIRDIRQPWDWWVWWR